jgi:transposase
MKKRTALKPVFKPYNMGQMLLMPQSYEEMIPEGHLVRVVNRAIDQIEVDSLLAAYAGAGPRAIIRR